MIFCSLSLHFLYSYEINWLLQSFAIFRIEIPLIILSAVRIENAQRWSSFPPEVTVKSLPLPANLKIVTVTWFSLPAWKNFETVTSFSLPAPQKIWNG
jgi:hypothetical protein